MEKSKESVEWQVLEELREYIIFNDIVINCIWNRRTR